MSSIDRNPEQASKRAYDLVIVGGGVYGAMILLEASRQGFKSLLLEKNDFGGATSYNSLRIIHGGFRYLQNLDLARFYESVRERSWFLETFPDLVKPLPCLFPLYNEGKHRSAVFRIALMLNDCLSYYRNDRLTPERTLGSGKIIRAEDVESLFPAVRRSGLKSGAVWYDAWVPDSQRLIIETIRWACSLGGVACNYLEATELKTENGRVTGVSALDRDSGELYEFDTSAVVNSAGPESRDIASKFDRDLPDLFRPSIGWNVLFNRKALSTHALALRSRQSAGHTYFITPWRDRLMAGTVHNPCFEDPCRLQIPDDLLQGLIDDINAEIGSLCLETGDIVKVFSGFLPARRSGETTNPSREVIVNHRKHGGPDGLYSVSGVKLTSSRAVAEKTLRQVFGGLRKAGLPSRAVSERTGKPVADVPFDWLPSRDDDQWADPLRPLIADEAVVHLEDLLFRRTGIGDNPERALELGRDVSLLFDWNEKRRNAELDRLALSCGAAEPSDSVAV